MRMLEPSEEERMPPSLARDVALPGVPVMPPVPEAPVEPDMPDEFGEAVEPDMPEPPEVPGEPDMPEPGVMESDGRCAVEWVLPGVLYDGDWPWV